MISYPIALEAVHRLDALFEIERTITAKPAAARLAVLRENGLIRVDGIDDEDGTVAFTDIGV